MQAPAPPALAAQPAQFEMRRADLADFPERCGRPEMIQHAARKIMYRAAFAADEVMMLLHVSVKPHAMAELRQARNETFLFQAVQGSINSVTRDARELSSNALEDALGIRVLLRIGHLPVDAEPLGRQPDLSRPAFRNEAIETLLCFLCIDPVAILLIGHSVCILLLGIIPI